MQQAAAGTVRASRRWAPRHGVVALAFCAVFICYIDRVNISVAALAMQAQYGWSETTKGLVLSSFFVGYLLFQVPSGWLANRVGGKRVLGAAVLAWSVFTFLTPLAATLSLGVLIGTRVCMGLGEAAMFPAAYNLFSSWVPASERSRAVGVFGSGIPLGTLFALTTTGWLVTHYGWPSCFYVFGMVGLGWALAWFKSVPPAPDAATRLLVEGAAATHASPVPAAHHIPWRALFSSTAVWALLLNHFCSNWTLYVLLAWLPSYFHKAQGLTITGAGLYSAAPWLTTFAMMNVVSWVADGLVRRGWSLTTVRKLMQTIGMLGPAVFLILVQWATTPGVALALMCGALGCYAFVWSGFAPNHLEIAPRHAGVLMGITNTTATIPGIVGVALTGRLVDATGTFTSAFALVAGIALFGAIVWLLFATAQRAVD